MKIDHRRKVHKKHMNNMIIGTQNHCAAANLANSKGGGTDFSIAAIMARGGSSREPSERSISKSYFDYVAKNTLLSFESTFHFPFIS